MKIHFSHRNTYQHIHWVRKQKKKTLKQLILFFVFFRYEKHNLFCVISSCLLSYYDLALGDLWIVKPYICGLKPKLKKISLQKI